MKKIFALVFVALLAMGGVAFAEGDGGGREKCKGTEACEGGMLTASINSADVFKGDVAGTSLVMCAGETMFRVAVITEQGEFTIFLNADNKKAIIVKHDEKGDMIEAAFGVIVDGPKLKQEMLLDREKVLEQYPSPCLYLVGKEA